MQWFSAKHGALAFLMITGSAAAVAPWLPLPDPHALNESTRLQGPSVAHWLGCDDLGRDVLSRLVHGGRYSLATGVVAVGLAFLVGVPIGLAAGYFRGWVDRVANTVADALLAFPSLVLALVVTAVLGAGLLPAMLAVGISQIPHYYRQARASALELASREFVLASLAAGAGPLFVLRHHLLPNVAPPLLVLATMGLGGAILDIAGLGFLGMTGDPNRPEWGGMLSSQRERFLSQPWLVVAPGLAITAAVLSFNLLGDAVRDALDPRLRSRHANGEQSGWRGKRE